MCSHLWPLLLKCITATFVRSVAIYSVAATCVSQWSITGFALQKAPTNDECHAEIKSKHTNIVNLAIRAQQRSAIRAQCSAKAHMAVLESCQSSCRSVLSRDHLLKANIQQKVSWLCFRVSRRKHRSVPWTNHTKAICDRLSSETFLQTVEHMKILRSPAKYK